MQVDITGADFSTLIGLTQRFPSGKVVAVKGRAYWDFEGQVQQPAQAQQPMQYAPQAQPPQPQPQKKGNAFFNMFDELASRI